MEELDEEAPEYDLDPNKAMGCGVILMGIGVLIAGVGAFIWFVNHLH